MVLGVISDTHGNIPLMFAVVEWLRNEMKADKIIHLGDDYADAEILATAGEEVVVVPGLWCPEYANPRIPKRQVLEIEGLRVCMAHAAKDLRASDWAADIVLTGHTHEACIEIEPGRIRMNPGHLKKHRDRGQNASFGLLKVKMESIEASIYEADGARLRIRELLLRRL